MPQMLVSARRVGAVVCCIVQIVVPGSGDFLAIFCARIRLFPPVIEARDVVMGIAERPGERRIDVADMAQVVDQ